MTVLVRDLHNKFLYGPSSLYYLGKVRFWGLFQCTGAFSVLVQFSEYHFVDRLGPAFPV
jgi:hypothetical protein